MYNIDKNGLSLDCKSIMPADLCLSLGGSFAIRRPDPQACFGFQNIPVYIYIFFTLYSSLSPIFIRPEN